MNDEETVALIAGGHTFGKTHVLLMRISTSGLNPKEPRLRSKDSVGRTPLAAGWVPTRSLAAWRVPGHRASQVGQQLLREPVHYEWELVKGPGGAWQWTPKDESAQGTVPDAHDPSKRHAPMMLTTDLSLRMDPIYEPISRRFYENPEEFGDASR